MSRIADALDKAGKVIDLPTRELSAADAIGAFAPGGGPVEIPAAAPIVHHVERREPREREAPVELRAAPSATRVDAFAHLRTNEFCVLHPGVDPVLAQQFRKLAGTLHQLQMERTLRTVVVTSAVPAEGKTLSAANMAVTLSESFKRRVLLVDADLRKPMLATLFGVPEATGLANLLANGDRVAPVVRITEHLSLLPGGRSAMDPVGSLTSERMRNLLADAAAEFDWVIVDTPPAALLPDAALLSGLVDGVLFVLRATSTPSGTVQRAIAAVTPERVIGVILNQADKQSLGEYGYYHRYGGKYGYEYAAPLPPAGGVTTPQV